MKNTILAAAVTLALTGAAFADDQQPRVQGSARDYGANPWGAGAETNQPSGGSASDDLSAPTMGLAGSVMGAAHMNGRLRNGQPLDPRLRSGDGDNSVIIDNGN